MKTDAASLAKPEGRTAIATLVDAKGDYDSLSQVLILLSLFIFKAEKKIVNLLVVHKLITNISYSTLTAIMKNSAWQKILKENKPIDFLATISFHIETTRVK